MNLNSENSDNLVVLLVKEVEEEIEGGISHGNILGVSDDAIAAVPHGAVLTDFSQVGVAAVAHGAVALDFAHIGVAAVAHVTIAAKLTKQTVTAVADIAVAIDAADIGVTAVAHSAVTLYLSYHRVAIVAYRLSIACLSHTHCHEKRKRRDGLHEMSHYTMHDHLVVRFSFLWQM